MADTVQATPPEPVKLPASRITAVWIRLPDFVRSFVIDAVEGAGAALVVVNFALPGDLTAAQAQAVIAATAIGGPVISAARRRLVPGIAGWLVRTFPRP